MSLKKIIFLSTNNRWGGSEVLWTYAMKELINSKQQVSAGVYYSPEFVTEVDDALIFNLNNRYLPLTRVQRILNKIKPGRFVAKDALKNWLIAEHPSLVVISQGNNVEGISLMQTCRHLKLKYITLTHLVVESTWPGLNDEKIKLLIDLYEASKKNFFVSSFVKQLHEKMLGYSSTNAEIIHNPFTKKTIEVFSYPAADVCRIALIGRLETFHKGYDLLLEVLKDEKWKTRPVQFSIYGKGQHKELLQRLINIYKIANVDIYDHNENVDQIWQSHHLLMMPSRLEGQSLTLIEAMYFSRPCLVTNVGGVAELVVDGETGFVATNISVPSIDEALERAWNLRADWEAMGIAAKKHINDRFPVDAVKNFNDKLMLHLNN